MNETRGRSTDHCIASPAGGGEEGGKREEAKGGRANLHLNNRNFPANLITHAFLIGPRSKARDRDYRPS